MRTRLTAALTGAAALATVTGAVALASQDASAGTTGPSDPRP